MVLFQRQKKFSPLARKETDKAISYQPVPIILTLEKQNRKQITKLLTWKAQKLVLVRQAPAGKFQFGDKLSGMGKL